MCGINISKMYGIWKLCRLYYFFCPCFIIFLKVIHFVFVYLNILVNFHACIPHLGSSLIFLTAIIRQIRCTTTVHFIKHAL